MEEGGFEKQRRNLLLMSSALVFFRYADVRIGKVNIAGLDVVVGNPQAVFVAVMVLFLYCLVRYFQYFSQGNYWNEIVVAWSDLVAGRTTAYGRLLIGRKFSAANLPQFYLKKVDGKLVVQGSFVIGVDGDNKVEYFSECLPLFYVVRAKLISFLLLFVVTHKISDYIFPFGWAFFAAVYYSFLA